MQDEFKGFLDTIVKIESSKTVGIVLKRIELSVEQAKKEGRDYLTLQEVEGLKSQVKEVLYEAYRNLRDFISTGNIVWEIINPKKGGFDGTK
jgi:hypothetical protein